MQNNDPAQEWGLPDWRDIDSYKNKFGIPDDWSDDRWRWEFKRRQPEYRKAFDELVRQGHDGTIHRDSITRQNEQGDLVVVEPRPNTPTTSEHADKLGFAFAADDNHREKFGMFFLPNPRFSEQPNNAILFGNRLLTGKRDESGLLIGEANWNFDLLEPLAPQIERCSTHLKNLQKQLQNAKIQRRQHKSLFSDYLQALDARECGVSYNGMVGIIPLDKPENSSARALANQALGVRDKM